MDGDHFDRAECNGIIYLRAKLAERQALHDSRYALVIGAEAKRIEGTNEETDRA